MHPRDQLGHLEGLRDVVIGAYLQPNNYVNRLGLSSEHDDRDLAFTPDRPTDLNPVHAWEHDVKNDEIPFPRLGRRESGGSIAFDYRLITGSTETYLKTLPKELVVLDYENARISFDIHCKIRVMESGVLQPVRTSGSTPRLE
jgi:hypothetical protein